MGNMLTSSFRTGVTYDFSIVSKGVFYIIEKDGDKFSLKDSLPVQINPSEFEYNTKTSANRIMGIDGECLLYRENNKLNEEVSINLKFDIYDEYLVGTSDGLIPRDDISLFNNKITILPSLINYSSTTEKGKPPYYTFFKWGDIEYYGILTHVNTAYTAFSRWGQPLKCDAKVEMSLINQDAANMSLKATLLEAKSFSKASNIANRVTLAALTAVKSSR